MNKEALMNFDINEMIISLTRANLEFIDLYSLTIPPDTKSGKTRTKLGVCGLVFPVKGRASFTVNGETTILEPGVILHAGADAELYKEVIGNSEWKFLLLHYRVICDDKTKKYMETRHFTFNIGTKGRQELDLLLQKLLKIQTENNPLSRFKCKVILYTIMEKIMFYLRKTMVDSKEELMGQIAEYIQENTEKNVSVSQLAEAADMDSKQFHYAFLKYNGMCPKKYIIHYKIKRAKELLEDGSYSISQVSDMVGYEDPLHFSRIFKKNTGVSPSLYQSQLEKNPWRI